MVRRKDSDPVYLQSKEPPAELNKLPEEVSPKLTNLVYFQKKSLPNSDRRDYLSVRFGL